MEEFSIRFRQSVWKDLSAIPKKDISGILTRIDGLRSNPRPHGSEKLTGSERYRLRQGKYRILYSIEEGILTIWVVAIVHRKDAYR